MKLTESKLKEMIKEMMTTGRLVHNYKPPLSENGRKIEEMLMSKKGELINQAESLFDVLSSTLDPLEADWLDALSKAAVATATLKRLSREEDERYSIPRSQRPERSPEYDQYDVVTNNFRDAAARIRRIVGNEEAEKIYRNFHGIVA